MTWTLSIKNINESKYIASEDNSSLNFEVFTNFSPRFINDKVYLDTDEYTAVLDGVVLNSKDLMQEYKSSTLSEYLIAAYQKNGQSFINDLRGSYNGCFFDKKKNIWFIFVNHFGDRPLFYYKNRDELIISSDFKEVLDCSRRVDGKYKYNEMAAYSILTYGFMIDDSTHIEGIKRLLPGRYIQINKGNFNVEKYFELSNKEIQSISFTDAIEELDIKFRKAVKRIFDKDLEYGYQSHLADMSGGLDARMVSWVAHEMGYSNITNICYSQSQAKEWRAALNVSNALGNDFIYMPLDKCNFIYDIEKLVSLNYGLSFYAGITGGERLLSYLHNNTFGLEMTGQLGDVIVGSYTTGKPKHSPPNFKDNKYSNYLNYEFNKEIFDEYDNHEMFTLYNRGFLGILSSHLIRNKYIDAVSPFLDIDLLMFCLSLPLEYRVNHKLYHAWIVRKYPICAEIPTSNYEGPVKENMEWINMRRKLKKGSIFYSRNILKKLGLNVKESPATMNPMDYWYKNDIKVREFINNYFEENKKRILPASKLSVDMDNLFYNGNTIEKLLILTVLASYKLFEINGE
ncbi:hypothetical protein JYA63_07010 [Fictibacillus nanhaiensis]|uniref:asparagine synthase (glutamine-hydrolyzing) n=1 Tax=Fictibacillus nanhaiensis TaxID=742169 RepID=A0ABS2ZRP8_9BACL|nr:hypothetical protein [Fictibacillus nanhaiensis]